jgi:diphosphomevalonate decarboxylase
MKSTAIAPSNIAFIKYWGKADDQFRTPLNPSISMNLSGAQTKTTVEFLDTYKTDSIEFIGEEILEKEVVRITSHLDRIRSLAGSFQYAKIVTKNSFPKGAGVASSASGFAALTVAAVEAIGLHLSEKEITELARIGSGSACRSIPDGFVFWENTYAYSLYSHDYWDLCDIVVIVDSQMKKVSTTSGMESVRTSPYLASRLAAVKGRIDCMKRAFESKNFQALGLIIEEDCLDMHHVMQTQTPRLDYRNSVTNELVKNIVSWRKEGLPVYFTIDAGPNVHCICESKNKDQVVEKVKNIHGVEQVIINTVASGTRLVADHLF